MSDKNISNKYWYNAIHYWLKAKYGIANKCESGRCNNMSKTYQWAKLKNKK